MSLRSSLPSQELSEGQRAALISLLGDEDPAVYQVIRGKLLSYGHEANEWLRPHILSNDPLVRRRSQEIVHVLTRQSTDNRFLAFCINQGEELNLEHGIWALAQTRYPEINIQAYEAVLDSYASDLRAKLPGAGASADEILATINHHLYELLGFTGNEQNYYDPDNSYLNRVIDRRTGNPISLCLIYLFLARRLRLPIVGIGLPGHFICRYQSSTEELYIDCFNRGKVLSKADCIKYLVENEHGFQESFLAPVTPRRILLRVCANLHQIYIQQERPEEVGRLQRYIVALAR